MAAPNIVGIITFTGTTSVVALTSAVQTIVSNSSDSGKVYKINSILIGNKSGTTATASVYYNSAASGAGSTTAIVRDASLLQNSSLVVLDRASSFYLEENKSITASAGAGVANPLDITISYEIIS